MLSSTFHLPLSSCVYAGDMRNFSRWKNTLAHMDKGRYAADTVLDYLQNKDNKALVFTDKHLVYLNLKRQRLRWALPVADLSSVTTHGVHLPTCWIYDTVQNYCLVWLHWRNLLLIAQSLMQRSTAAVKSCQREILMPLWWVPLIDLLQTLLLYSHCGVFGY